MSRAWGRAWVWATVAVLAGAGYAGCTQDFGQFEGTGGGSTTAHGGSGPGSGAAGPSTGGSTTTSMSSGGGGAGGCSSAGMCPNPSSDCEKAACNGGTCGTEDLPKGTACATMGGQKCDGQGQCVACLGDGDCMANLTCDLTSHTCKGCTNPGQCGDTGTACVTFSCDAMMCNQHIHEGDPCNDNGGQICTNAGLCVECIGDAQCTPPETCSGGGPANQCGCTSSVTCGSANQTCGRLDDGCGTMLNCDNGKDGAETDVDCGGSSSACPTRCANGKNCMANGDCQTGHCAADPSGKCGKDNQAACGGDTECASGNCSVNAGNLCGADNGGNCTGDGDCASNNCASSPANKCGLDNGSDCTGPGSPACASQNCVHDGSKHCCLNVGQTTCP